jgi:hypothetical protein
MHLRHVLPVVSALAALLYACDDHDEPSQVGDVVLQGTVTDEAFLALESALGQGAPKTDPSKAATLDQPVEAAMLPRATPPTFTWHFGSGMVHRGPSRRSLELREDTAAAGWAFGSAPSSPRAGASVFAASLRMLLAPVKSAHAHGDPFNGTGTFLVFSTETAPSLVRVFTSNTIYTPSTEAWAKMTSAGAPIKLVLATAIFEQNRVAQDGGPFAGSTTTFTVAP